MKQNTDTALLDERMRQLAIEQMMCGVASIIFTRVANGNIEVSLIQELTDFGKPSYALVDQATKEIIRRQ